MIDKLKDCWGRLRIRWHVLLAALALAAPEILNYLGGIDLKPVLVHFMREDTAAIVMGILPFALIFLKSAVHMDTEDDK